MSNPVISNAVAKEIIENAILRRSDLLKEMFDPRRDIDSECGYPKELDATQYRYLYDREGVGHRIVTVLPEECWAMDPIISENEDPDETEFEAAWEDLQQKRNIYHFLQRIDEVSGIGRFGVLFLGLSDGEDTALPVAGVNENDYHSLAIDAKVALLEGF